MMNFLGDFQATSKNKWIEKINKDLKSGTYQDLIHTKGGLNISPAVSEEDVAMTLRPVSFPENWLLMLPFDDTLTNDPNTCDGVDILAVEGESSPDIYDGPFYSLAENSGGAREDCFYNISISIGDIVQKLDQSNYRMALKSKSINPDLLRTIQDQYSKWCEQSSIDNMLRSVIEIEISTDFILEISKLRSVRKMLEYVFDGKSPK